MPISHIEPTAIAGVLMVIFILIYFLVYFVFFDNPDKYDKKKKGGKV